MWRYPERVFILQVVTALGSCGLLDLLLGQLRLRGRGAVTGGVGAGTEGKGAMLEPVLTQSSLSLLVTLIKV